MHPPLDSLCQKSRPPKGKKTGFDNKTTWERGKSVDEAQWEKGKVIEDVQRKRGRSIGGAQWKRGKSTDNIPKERRKSKRDAQPAKGNTTTSILAGNRFALLASEDNAQQKIPKVRTSKRISVTWNK